MGQGTFWCSRGVLHTVGETSIHITLCNPEQCSATRVGCWRPNFFSHRTSLRKEAVRVRRLGKPRKPLAQPRVCTLRFRFSEVLEQYTVPYASTAFARHLVVGW